MTQVNGIAIWAEGIKAELAQRLPRQRKTQRDKLAVLVATMLHVRSANLVEVAAGLPRASDRWDMGYQWISRFLANGLVCCDDVMAPFAREILAWLAETGAPIPLILDQTKASDRHQILMLSVRWGERALPLAWRVAETEGAIGFATQQELLEVVAGWLSVGQAVILLADRFYGTPEMICWCGDRGMGLSAAAQGNLVARLGATRTTTGALALSGGHYFENIILTGKRITTNLGIIRDPGHTEPWIIAMSAKPGYPHHPGIRRALGHRAHVFGFQIARVWSPTDPSPLSRPPRPPDIGHGSRPLFGRSRPACGTTPTIQLPPKKAPGPSAGQARPRKTFLVHPWPPARHQASPRMPPAPKALEMSDKLIDAQIGNFD